MVKMWLDEATPFLAITKSPEARIVILWNMLDFALKSLKIWELKQVFKYISLKITLCDLNPLLYA